MNEIEKAIELLNDELKSYDNLIKSGLIPRELVNENMESLALSIQLLEKQIPKKPFNRDGYPQEGRDTSAGQCIKCMCLVTNITPKYKTINWCKNCGQAIDWSGDE